MIENNQKYWNEGYWKRVINNQKIHLKMKIG